MGMLRWVSRVSGRSPKEALMNKLTQRSLVLAAVAGLAAAGFLPGMYSTGRRRRRLPRSPAPPAPT
jgi:hypothetical protein